VLLQAHFLITTHTHFGYTLTFDMHQERELFRIIVGTMKAKIILVSAWDWNVPLASRDAIKTRRPFQSASVNQCGAENGLGFVLSRISQVANGALGVLLFRANRLLTRA
jgi:hypothetical protein